MKPKPRVLIVDDETDLVDMLAMRLEADGRFAVSKAHDGAEALAEAAQTPPDVVLLDSVMPGVDGWEVCRRLRGDPRTREAVVIIMTAANAREAKRRLEESGADRLVLKPYDQGELLGIVGEAAGGRR